MSEEKLLFRVCLLIYGYSLGPGYYLNPEAFMVNNTSTCEYLFEHMLGN